MRNALFVGILLFTTACGDRASNPSRVVSDSTSIAAALPGLSVRFLEPASTESPDSLRSLRFSYARADGRWPYGWGVAVLSHSPGSLRWLALEVGDTPIHPPHLLDFDADGKSDLFYHAGEETDFNTYLFLNRVVADSFALSNFGLGMSSNEVYAVVLDLDGDSLPELLFPDKQSEESDLLAEDCEAPLRHGPIGDRIAAEYSRLAGPWSDINFSYGSPRPGLINLFVTDSVRVFSLVGPERWAQSRFSEHLRWRISVLEEARPSASAHCQSALSEVVGYLRSQLAAP